MKSLFVISLLSSLLFLVHCFPAESKNALVTLPQCSENEDCLHALCACCGVCSKENNFKCKQRADVDCARAEIRIDENFNKLTAEERTASNEFWKYAMKKMNDSTVIAQ